ncbi:MAG TPA: heterodisulfide reductase-related iron-sulfur binding cluster [Vicinamibacterales bacterium]|nr:heterodisulfide reductase-related iron-sulfur binding cluster [Vicinamibacterales bacterium]
MSTPTSTFASLGEMQPLIDTCVHCGFCLPACPSYLLLNQEMDSPRGRIYLMKGGVEGRVPMSPDFMRHFDTCLGCMACETACPSGVRYAPLIEETRAAIERAQSRPAASRWFRSLMFNLLPYPSRLRVAAAGLGAARLIQRHSWIVQALPDALRALVELAPAPRTRAPAVPETTNAKGERRRRVGLLTGCVQSVFFSDVNAATARVLAAEGCEVAAPRPQTCCGALALHAGRDEDARAFAKSIIHTFEQANVDHVVVNAAGCGSTLKTYGSLLEKDPQWADRARSFANKVRDATEMLAELGPPRGARHPLPAAVAYHDACHLAHAQGIRAQPRTVLSAIPGVRLIPLAENDVCCGSAGIFNLVQPQMAEELGRRKMARVEESNAEIVATSNPGCILQLEAAARRRGARVTVVHVIELVDASLNGRPIDRVRAGLP